MCSQGNIRIYGGLSVFTIQYKFSMNNLNMTYELIVFVNDFIYTAETGTFLSEM